MRQRSIWYVGLLAIGCVLAAGCGREPESVSVDDIRAGLPEAPPIAGLSIDYPLPGALFPPDIAPPTLVWTTTTPRADTWLVRFSFGSTDSPIDFLADSARFDVPDDAWETIRQQSTGREASITVYGVSRRRPARILCAGTSAFSTSEDEVGAPILYRDVNLPFATAVRDPSTICWRYGSVSSKTQPPVVLEKLPVCGNCHSVSADGKVFGMDVDYANDKGSYAVLPIAQEMVLNPDRIISWSDYEKEDDVPTYGLLSRVSPDGRHVVSTVKDRSVFVARPDLAFSQLFFPIRGILAVYSRGTGEFAALPGADSPEFVQSNPCWSPDGKEIVFARSTAYKLKEEKAHGGVLLPASACDEFLSGGRTFKFDLYRMPFSDGKGGTPEPVAGASHNGLSNYFPKFSPDGKWIVFCRANSFMLLQPDSELFIIPAKGGEARRLACNTDRMNSWHSWSPNSKWLVFASKSGTPYTRLWLTHIDEDGRSSVPVVLEKFSSPDRAANIPEFVNAPEDAIVAIREDFLNVYSFRRAGLGELRDGHPLDAERYLKKAIELDPQDVVSLMRLAQIAEQTGRREEAAKHLRSLASALVETRRHDRRAAAAVADVGCGLDRLGHPEDAVGCYRKAIEMDPELPQAHYNLAGYLRQKGQMSDAIRHYQEALRLQPKYLNAMIDLAGVRAGAYGPAGKDVDEAIELLERACKLTERKDPMALRRLASVYAGAGRTGDAVRAAEEALALVRGVPAAGPLADALRQELETYRRPDATAPE